MDPGKVDWSLFSARYCSRPGYIPLSHRESEKVSTYILQLSFAALAGMIGVGGKMTSPICCASSRSAAKQYIKRPAYLAPTFHLHADAPAN